MKLYLITVLICITMIHPGFSHAPSDDSENKLRIVLAGASHDHVNRVFRMGENDIFKVVGISEADQGISDRLAAKFDLDKDLFYRDLAEALDETRPEAVCAFGSIYAHLEVVRQCAPRGIHVMVEKPLSYTMDHAEEMQRLASEHDIHLLTNYETTWYPSGDLAYELAVEKKEIGDLRKLVFHDGHKGPKEIGCSPGFLDWLTDPKGNGGGALIDFGCYGANLSTWYMKNEKPSSVTAITQTMKPSVYPEVDDEATIVLTYPEMQTIIQASWNWPYGRKDMEMYGNNGVILTPGRNQLEIRKGNEKGYEAHEPEALKAPYDNEFAYFRAVVRGKADPANSLSSLENNMIVVQILDAARKSAEKGITINLD